MLHHGKIKAKKANLDINFQLCSADDLPFSDNSFNAYTISFGIRNCMDKEKVNFLSIYMFKVVLTN